MRKEAGFKDALRGAGRFAAREGRYLLPAVAGGAAAFGLPGLLGVGGAGVLKGITMGLGGALGAQTGKALADATAPKPQKQAIDPRLLSALIGMHGNMAQKTAAPKDNAYYDGVAHAQQAFQALQNFGLTHKQLKRVHNILKKSPGAASKASWETPTGARNYRRGTTKAFKNFLNAAKDVDSFRQQGVPAVNAQVDHESGKTYYREPGADQHFAVRRPGMLWGSKLETYGMPKAAGLGGSFVHVFDKLSAENSSSSGGINLSTLRRRLEEHAMEHAMMKRLGIGDRSFSFSASSLLR